MPDISNIRRLLAHYDLGDIIDCVPVEREIPQLQACFYLRTGKGDFFVKCYGSFDRSKRSSYKVIRYLSEHGYPAVRVIPTRLGRPYVRQNGGGYAIFEYLPQKEQSTATAKEAREIGRSLARLHNLMRDVPLHRSDLEKRRFVSSFQRNRGKIVDSPDEVKPIFEFMERNINCLEPPEGTPLTACHGEFTLQHLRFERESLVSVIDWDCVGRDYAIVDLGTTLSDAIDDGHIDFGMIRNIVGGYSEERPLTSWERDHLFEAAQFGGMKFAVWALEAVEQLGWDRFSRRVSPLLGCDRATFYEQLARSSN